MRTTPNGLTRAQARDRRRQGPLKARRHELLVALPALMQWLVVTVGNKVLDLGKMTKPGLEGPGGGG